MAYIRPVFAALGIWFLIELSNLEAPQWLLVLLVLGFFISEHLPGAVAVLIVGWPVLAGMGVQTIARDIWPESSAWPFLIVGAVVFLGLSIPSVALLYRNAKGSAVPKYAVSGSMFICRVVNEILFVIAFGVAFGPGIGALARTVWPQAPMEPFIVVGVIIYLAAQCAVRVNAIRNRTCATESRPCSASTETPSEHDRDPRRLHRPERDGVNQQTDADASTRTRPPADGSPHAR